MLWHLIFVLLRCDFLGGMGGGGYCLQISYFLAVCFLCVRFGDLEEDVLKSYCIIIGSAFGHCNQVSSTKKLPTQIHRILFHF